MEWNSVLYDKKHGFVAEYGKGLLVCEFGANGNIAAIENAFAKASNSLGYGYEPKFNFPTVEDFGKLLEDNGFVIDRIYDYDRPTV